MGRLDEFPVTPGLGGCQLHEASTAPNHSPIIEHLPTTSAECQMSDIETCSSGFDSALPAASSSAAVPSNPSINSSSPGCNFTSGFQTNFNTGEGGLTLTSLPPLDPIIEAANKFIQSERKRNFSFLGRYSRKYKDTKELLAVTHAEVQEVQALRTQIDRLSMTNSPNYRWYVFSEPLCSESLRRIIAIDLLPDEPVNAANMIVVGRDNDDSVLMLDAWLRESYEWHDTYDMRFGDIQQYEQQLWWESTGKTFRLLDLPLELRENIYLHFIGPVILPDIDPSKKQSVTFGAGLSYGDKHRHGVTLDPDIEPPNLTVLRLNKQVHSEAMEVAHRDTFKRFHAVGGGGSSEIQPRSTSSFHVNITGIQSLAPHAAFLRNMQLEMSAVRYFSFVGIQPTFQDPVGLNDTYSRENPLPRRAEADVLRTFTALQRLDLRFISPKHPKAVCPWTVSPDATRSENHSCQKLWIDWFLTFAWDHLKNLKGVKITLSGCVKDSTRKHWESVLNDRIIDWTSGIKQMECAIWENKVDPHPIPCRCSTPCSKADNPLAHHAWTQHDLRMMEGLQTEMTKIYWDFND